MLEPLETQHLIRRDAERTGERSNQRCGRLRSSALSLLRVELPETTRFTRLRIIARLCALGLGAPALGPCGLYITLLCKPRAPMRGGMGRFPPGSNSSHRSTSRL